MIRLRILNDLPMTRGRTILKPHQHQTGCSRRELLQVGSSGLLGLGLPSLLAGRTQAAETSSAMRTPKSVVIVFLTRAPSHHDTFDMKLDAPAEIRGEFQPIATSIPGYQICEHLPQLAARANKYTVVRSLSHNDNNHLMSTHHVLTGEPQPGGFFDKIASRDDWPCYSAGLAYLRPRGDGLPSGVNLPTFLREGPLTWPGQHAGLLGPNYDPWQITGDPSKPDFRVDALTLAQGIDVNQLGRRQVLLDEVNRQQSQLGEVAQSIRLQKDQQLAISMLTSSRLAQAFELHRESPEVRNRYGENSTGQSLLLARRLIESGVPIVQANIGRVQNWDSHSDIFPTLKNRLLPSLDQGVAALLDDLETRRTAGEHSGDDARRVRSHSEDQRPARPRPLGTLLLWTLRRRGRPRRPDHRPLGRYRILSSHESILPQRRRRDGLSPARHTARSGSSRPAQSPGASQSR